MTFGVRQDPRWGFRLTTTVRRPMKVVCTPDKELGACVSANLYLPLELKSEVKAVQLGKVVQGLLIQIVSEVNDIKDGTVLSISDILSPLGQLAHNNCTLYKQSDALKAFINFEALRIHRESQMATTEENSINTQIAKWGSRVTILHQLAKEPYIYKLNAGRRKDSTIEVDVSKRPASDADIGNMIDTIVDIMTSTWEAMHLINVRYDTTATPTLLDRGRLRSRQRDLWKTAAKHFKAEHNAKYQNHLSSRFHDNVETMKTRGAKIPRNMPVLISTSNKATDKTTTAKSQYNRYMKNFRDLSQKLSNGTLLNISFHSSRRMRDCPVLLQAHQEAGRIFISSNKNATVTGKQFLYNSSSYLSIEVGFYPIQREGYITPLSTANENILCDYIRYLNDLESHGEQFLGPHFLHLHDGAGYALHLHQDCPRGHFLLYQAECRLEADRQACDGDRKRDDLFGMMEHVTGNDAWSCSLDPQRYSNFARYIGGVSPNRLDDANCIAFTVEAGGYYHILIVLMKDAKAGDALQYYYRGLKDELKYKKIPSVPVAALA